MSAPKLLPCAVCGMEPAIDQEVSYVGVRHGRPAGAECPSGTAVLLENIHQSAKEWNRRQRAYRKAMRAGIPKFDAANAKLDPRGWA